MKWIVVLMTCFALNTVYVDGQCDLGPPFDYNPEKISGVWYVVYAVPDIFQQYVGIQLLYELRGELYETDVIAIPIEEGKEVLYSGIFYIKKNNTLLYQSPTLTPFNGEYRITSVVYDRYLVFRGCAPAISDKEITLVLFRKRCTDKESEHEARLAVEQLGMNADSFPKDPSIVCSH